MAGIVTLTTDFGTADAYVGVMKGVMLSTAPGLVFVDITHHIPPQDVLRAALVVKSAYRWFPAGSAHLAVVDPGVGSGRRGLAVRCGEWFFVGPDNGIFTCPIREHGAAECVEIPAVARCEVAGQTFDGRDMFAPAAARIASGMPLSEIGPSVCDPVLLDIPEPRISESSIEGEITYIDSFGNCISNIGAADIGRLGRPAEVIIRVEGRSVGPLRRFYSEVPPGDPLALIDSVEMLEIAVNRGSAAKDMGIGVGAPVTVGVLKR